jgi:hypothetical protein
MVNLNQNSRSPGRYFNPGSAEYEVLTVLPKRPIVYIKIGLFQTMDNVQHKINIMKQQLLKLLENQYMLIICKFPLHKIRLC